MGSDNVERALATVRSALRSVDGAAAIVLGGSRATGTAGENSDIDIGLFYSRADRPDFGRLLGVVSTLDDRGQPDGYGEYGAWGPWINGGFWLRVGGLKTDILLREIEHMRDVLQQCAEGRPRIHYQVGHPHGFCTAIYAGEVATNTVLHDPGGVVARLRTLVDPYPDPLAEALIAQFAWESTFSVQIARSAADRADVHYVGGCGYRSIACLNQVLFAANRRYLLNEKGATAVAARLPATPTDYERRVNGILGDLAPNPASLRGALDRLDELRSDVLIAVGAPD